MDGEFDEKYIREDELKGGSIMSETTEMESSKKSKKILMWLGIVVGAVCVWVVVSHMMRVSALNKMQNVFSGSEVTIADEGLQPEGFYVSYLVRDSGIIEETNHESKGTDVLSMYKKKEAVSFKGVNPGDTYILWLSQYSGDKCCIKVFSVIVDDELTTSLEDVATYNIKEIDFDKYDSDVAKALNEIKDEYGFSEDDIVKALPGVSLE